MSCLRCDADGGEAAPPSRRRAQTVKRDSSYSGGSWSSSPVVSAVRRRPMWSFIVDSAGFAQPSIIAVCGPTRSAPHKVH